MRATGLAILHALFDPNGRADRRGLALLAVVLLAVQGAFAAALAVGLMEITGAPAIGLKITFAWIALAAAAKRLHDLGRSALWMLAAVLAIIAYATAIAAIMLVIGGPMLIEPGSRGFLIANALVMLPVFAATLWLHLARGDQGRNRYGTAPHWHGFSLPASTDDGRSRHGPEPSTAPRTAPTETRVQPA